MFLLIYIYIQNKWQSITYVKPFPLKMPLASGWARKDPQPLHILILLFKGNFLLVSLLLVKLYFNSNNTWVKPGVFTSQDSISDWEIFLRKHFHIRMKQRLDSCCQVESKPKLLYSIFTYQNNIVVKENSWRY